MPDPPPNQRQPRPLPGFHPGPARAPAVPYAELHCKTNFSFLEGASHPDELVQRARELGLSALAITDRHSLAGVVRAHAAAREIGLPLLIGAEVWPVDAPPAVLLAQDRAGYGRLARLLTLGRRAAPKGECWLRFAQVAEHSPGLLAAVFTPSATQLRQPRALPPADWQAAGPTAPFEPGAGGPPRREPPTVAALAGYREAFGDRAALLAELHRGPDDRRWLARLEARAKAAAIPLLAGNDVHYHDRGRRPLQDVLTAIRLRAPVATLGDQLFPNAERCLKGPAEMAALFAHAPDLVARTAEFAQRCHFSLAELRYEYPEELCPAGRTPLEQLRELSWRGARDRYPHGIPERVSRLLEHELALIAELNYEAYFLTVWDLVRFANERGILCQGRGSAANSVVCFCLGVTAVDPAHIDVLFERFISRERHEAPDIDVDFEHERREEVIQYIYEKYGRERAGMTAALSCYRPRSAVRDVGRALGLSLDRVDTLTAALEHSSQDERLTARLREAGLNVDSRLARRLQELVGQLLDFPRHLSQHVGGLVMTRGPLCELVPIENASMPGRTVIEWDKNDLDTLGILKVDCLSLGMLSAIRRCFDLLSRRHGRECTLANVPAEDPHVYEMISRGDTMGVFQIESRAQMAMLPRLKPRCFYDLVIEVAIVRPGPIQGDMVHPYLRRRQGLEAVDYPDERIRAVLDKTLGVPIFQEQAMRLAVVAAGFSPGEADQLRRAMGAWRRPGVIDQFQRKLIAGMHERGYSSEFAERLFRQIRGFGEYGFPESHAASFARLVYVSAWLKRYYPAAFTAALLNSQPMGFYAPAQLVAQARKAGIEIRPADVNFSDWDCTLEWPDHHPAAATTASPAPPPPPTPTRQGSRGDLPSAGERIEAGGAAAANRVPRGLMTGAGGESGAGDEAGTTPLQPALRLGLRQISGLSQRHVEQLVAARAAAPFRNLADLARRSQLPESVLARLARGDACGSLAGPRRQALWQSLRPAEQKTLFFDFEDPEPQPALPALSPWEEVLGDYRTTGLSLRQHPLAFLREQLAARRIAAAGELARLPDGRRVKVAGLVLMRQRPGTASGITFVTLEDETGLVNLIVRPNIWERDRRAGATSAALLAYGRLQHKDGVTHVLADRLEELTLVPAENLPKSRDFR